jgi:hypothetical protein
LKCEKGILKIKPSIINNGKLLKEHIF